MTETALGYGDAYPVRSLNDPKPDWLLEIEAANEARKAAEQAIADAKMEEFMDDLFVREMAAADTLCRPYSDEEISISFGPEYLARRQPNPE